MRDDPNQPPMQLGDDGELPLDLSLTDHKIKRRPSIGRTLRRNALRIIGIAVPVGFLTILVTLWALSRSGAIQPGALLCKIDSCLLTVSPAPIPSPTLIASDTASPTASRALNQTATYQAQQRQTSDPILTKTALTAQVIRAQRSTDSALTQTPAR